MIPTAVIIPSYNAAVPLPALLQRVLAVTEAGNIIVVDDGSTDGTGRIAASCGIRVVSHGVNRGKGAALQSGFDAALAGGFEAVVTMDADLQHEPERIPEFIREAERGPYDVIIGSRMRETSSMPFHRLLSNTITSFLVRLRTGAAITDSQSGFRFIRSSILRKVRIASAGFEGETEFLIKAAAAGARFGSVPIRTIYAGEKSHMTHLRTTLHFIRVLLERY